MKKISVVINTYNENPAYLRRAIESYLNQIDVSVEVLISTIEGDKNMKIINSYPIKLITTPIKSHPGKSPEGSYLQIENAIPYCTGEYFCFASSNDWALPEKLYNELSCLQNNNAKICYSAYNLCHPSEAILEPIYFQDYNYEVQRKSNFVSDCALIEMAYLKKYLPFRKVGNFAFWDLWLRIGKDTNRGDKSNVFFYYHYPTWNYRKNNDSMSRQRSNTIEGRMQYQIDKENFIKKYHT